jgi:hypothetical protein
MRVSTPTDETYSELQQAYDFYNQALFEGRLPPCLFTLQRQKRTFGYFSKERFSRLDGTTTDEIAINPEYFASAKDLLEVLQTLVHEMVHLWQAHFGTPSRACYHNREWADKMESLGLMPSSTGVQGGRRVGQKMADYVITDGRFEQATNELRGGGWKITWYDRYPAPVPPVPPVPMVPAPEWSGLSTTTSSHPIPTSSGVDTQTPLHALPQLFMERTGNLSNRIKYTCPSCSANAWGKPKLNLVCGNCNVPFSDGSG